MIQSYTGSKRGGQSGGAARSREGVKVKLGLEPEQDWGLKRVGGRAVLGEAQGWKSIL